MICDASWRMNALSSTTSTRGLPDGLENTGALAQRPHLDPSIQHMKEHAAAVVAAGVFGHDRHFRVGQRISYRDDVALANVDAAGRQQVPEHARTADDLRAHA